MNPMWRVLGFLTSLILSLVGSVHGGAAAAGVTDVAVQAYTYDAASIRPAPAYDHVERRPPSATAAGRVSAGQRALDHRWRGVSARSELASTTQIHAYNDVDVLAPRDNRTPVAELAGTKSAMVVAGSGRATSVLNSGTRVAAKGAPERASGKERTGSAVAKGDPFHRSVSWVVDNPAAQRFAIKGGDGVSRELYQLPGEVNGKSGVFEWIIDRSGTNPVINHQRFIPGGSVTGFPNQVAP